MCELMGWKHWFVTRRMDNESLPPSCARYDSHERWFIPTRETSPQQFKNPVHLLLDILTDNSIEFTCPVWSAWLDDGPLLMAR